MRGSSAAGPRPAGLEVASGADQDACAARQRGLGFAGAGRDGAKAAQHGPDTWNGEQQIMGEHAGRGADAAARQDFLRARPYLGHVEQAGMVPGHQHGAVGGQPVQPFYPGG